MNVVQGECVITRNVTLPWAKDKEETYTERCVAWWDDDYMDTFYVGKGQWHRIHNPTDKECVIIEIWKGDHLSEDDIERKEDDYGRV